MWARKNRVKTYQFKSFLNSRIKLLSNITFLFIIQIPYQIIIYSIFLFNLYLFSFLNNLFFLSDFNVLIFIKIRAFWNSYLRKRIKSVSFFWELLASFFSVFSCFESFSYCSWSLTAYVVLVYVVKRYTWNWVIYIR